MASEGRDEERGGDVRDYGGGGGDGGIGSTGTAGTDHDSECAGGTNRNGDGCESRAESKSQKPGDQDEHRKPSCVSESIGTVGVLDGPGGRRRRRRGGRQP